MKVLIQQARIISPESSLHDTITDLLIEDGKIIETGQIKSKADKVISGDNLHVSAGWLDMRVHLKDPGHELMENLESMSQAAMKGGFTEIVGLPNTHPTVQTKESLSYFRNFSQSGLVRIYNIAAVTKNCEGKDFTEMIDLFHSGATAFSDGVKPIWNADILLKSLQYLYPLGALLINKPEEPTLSIFGQMHEGLASTLMGTKGIPSAAEEIMIMRDLKLLEYSGIQSEQPVLHFTTISTAQSVRLIREAKKKGLPVSCDIAAHQLAFIDEDLKNFDTHLKVNPPFRSKEDIAALKKGLADGTIDAVVSDHNPLDEEVKNLEFDLAEFGITGLQTAFATLNTYGGQDITATIGKITAQPRKLLRLSNPVIEKGSVANLTVFDPAAEFVLKTENIVSLSKNSPFIDKPLKGKVLAVYNQGRLSES